jgi:hypothetical protein
MALRTYNLPAGSLKKRLFWSRWSYNSSYWKTILTHFLHSENRKNDLDEVAKVVLCRLMAWVLIISLLDVLKTTLANSIKRCIKDPKSNANSFFVFCTSKNGHGRSRLRVVLSRRMALRTHNPPSRHLKKLLCWSRWSDVSRCRKAIRNHFLLPEIRLRRLEEVA